MFLSLLQSFKKYVVKICSQKCNASGKVFSEWCVSFQQFDYCNNFAKCKYFPNQHCIKSDPFCGFRLDFITIYDYTKEKSDFNFSGDIPIHSKVIEDLEKSRKAGFLHKNFKNKTVVKKLLSQKREEKLAILKKIQNFLPGLIERYLDNV